MNNLVEDPIRAALAPAYRHVIEPLRSLGLMAEIEEQAGNYVISVPLADSSRLTVHPLASLPLDPATVMWWQALRTHDDNPTIGEIVYDSTEDGAEETSPAVGPLISHLIAWLLARPRLHGDLPARLGALAASVVAVELPSAYALQPPLNPIVAGVAARMRTESVEGRLPTVLEVDAEGDRIHLVIHPQRLSEWNLWCDLLDVDPRRITHRGDYASAKGLYRGHGVAIVAHGVPALVTAEVKRKHR
ncbi:hypothetical protein [Streptomyces sp. NPDC088925]|uniref:hypothetical protein n=1 Tax=Streptomyces sp. NPDC088925 TaxID=3365914 RepID=UPI0037F7355D